jgi:hypothetical protein
MRLHENPELFRQSIRFTADQIKIKAIFVEKDYWVTLALFEIFSGPHGADALFKGGTSLSKCFHLVERFSEDIDLLLVRREGETNNKLKSKLKAVSNAVSAKLPEVYVHGVTHKRGMLRKTAHFFPSGFAGDFGQVRKELVLESTLFGSPEPALTCEITSLVGQMMHDRGQSNLATEYGLVPFTVNTLDPSRTLCEKIMSLVRFSYSEDPMNDLNRKIRHVYDLHVLLQHDVYKQFVHSPDFDRQLIQVAREDRIALRDSSVWLGFHPSEALFFRNLTDVWKGLKLAYQNDFRPMVYGKFPSADEVLESMKLVRIRLNAVPWAFEHSDGVKDGEG